MFSRSTVRDIVHHYCLRIFKWIRDCGDCSRLGLAILMARSTLIEGAAFPYLNILRVMPVVAIAPLLIIWFGHGLTPMIIVAALIAFFPLVVTTILGLRSVDPDLTNLRLTLNASEH